MCNENTNSRVDRLERRALLFCSYCRPHRGENASYTAWKRAHGRKPKGKNKRRA